MTSTALSTLFLYLDIETIPSQDPSIRAEIEEKHVVPDLDGIIDAIVPSANLKDPEKIEADMAKRRQRAIEMHQCDLEAADDKIEEEYRKTALDGTTGHIACVSLALGDDEIVNVANSALGLFSKPHVVVAPGDNGAIGQRISIRPGLQMVLEDERRMLEQLFDQIEALVSNHTRDIAEAKWADLQRDGIFIPAEDPRVWLAETAARFRRPPIIVAHHAQFDVKFVWQRCIILGVKVPAWWPHDARPWDTERLQDTMTGWAGLGNRIGLDRLCRALGIPGKGDIDGSKVWDAVQAGRINDVCQYCDDDVARLRKVHNRITGRVRVIERGSRASDPVEPMPDDLPAYLPGGDDHARRERGTSPHLGEH